MGSGWDGKFSRRCRRRRRISLSAHSLVPAGPVSYAQHQPVGVRGGGWDSHKPSGTLTRAIPIAGMPYLIKRNPHHFHFPRFLHISQSAHLFTPGTHLFFRFIMKLAGSPDSQPKQLSKTPSREIYPNPNLLYFSNISPNVIADPVSSQLDLKDVPPRNFRDPSRVVASALLYTQSFLEKLLIG